MPVVRDPTGREWIVEEHGLGGDAVSFRPGDRLLEHTHAMLRVRSGDESFFVIVQRDWRELSGGELWELLDRARQRGEQGP